MPATIDVKRGDTLRLIFEYIDSNGVPIDLSGCSARMQIRTKREKTLLLELVESDGLSLDSLAGTVVIRKQLPADFLVGSHEFDLEMTYSDGTVESTNTLILKVIEDVTYDG